MRISLCVALALLFTQPVWADQMLSCDKTIRQGDESLAYKGCLPAAREGNPKAQLLVGMALMTGVGVKKDPAAAVAWWQKSADQYYPGGLYQLALAKIAGLGTQEDEAGGMVLIAKAAELGDPRAKDFMAQVGSTQIHQSAKKAQPFNNCIEVGCDKPKL
ncbi:MAG: tetratricopeptide repeat protein [Fluviibacter sp.]